MAIKTLKDITFDSRAAGDQFYAVFEANNMSAQITRTRAQLPLDINGFTAGPVNYPCEQGMLLVYDEAKGVVRKAVDKNDNVMIHYSEYKLYDTKWSLKNFALWAQRESIVNIAGPIQRANGVTETNGGAVSFYDDKTPFPRMYVPMVQDTFTTNLIVFNDATFVDFGALEAAVADGDLFATVYVGPEQHLKGYYELAKGTAPTAKVVFRAIKAYDLPDGQPALRLEVWSVQ